MTPTERAARLNRMKRLALALLVAMFGLYIVAGIYEDQHAVLPYIRAFAEAATVGALADWFAVTALFRHPLGIPIPHTAIIQRRKNDIGETLSRFVAENFLVTQALAPRLNEIQFSGLLSKWLSKPANARRLTQDLAGVLTRVVTVTDNRALRDAGKQSLRNLLGRSQLTPLFGELLELLLLKDPEQTLVNGLLSVARRQLDDNRLTLQETLSDRTPWWLPRFVDRRIFDRLIDELDAFLATSRDADDDTARAQLIELLGAMITALKTDEALIERGEALKEKILEHPWLQQFLSGIVNDFSHWLTAALEDPESDLRRHFSNALEALGERLSNDESLQQDLDSSCREALLYVVERYNDSIAGIISETVKNWDAEATALRIEQQVGRDLQFIRINGTIVGGLVGLTLHVLWQFGPFHR